MNVRFDAWYVFPHRTTEYSTYSPETYDGHWKQLTVRTSRTKQAMAMIYFNPQVLKLPLFGLETKCKTINFNMRFVVRSRLFS